MARVGRTEMLVCATSPERQGSSPAVEAPDFSPAKEGATEIGALAPESNCRGKSPEINEGGRFAGLKPSASTGASKALIKGAGQEKEKLEQALAIFTELKMPRERDAVQKELEKVAGG